MKIELEINLLVGTIKFENIETGFWTLVCDDGVVYRINNPNHEIKKDNLKVAVIAEQTKNTMSIYMKGKELKILEYKILTLL